LVVITVLKGVVMFSCDLVRAMETETEMAFLSASSYSEGFTPGEALGSSRTSNSMFPAATC
jgi:hypoxanthine-guanine phosphoribosyltransferase